MCIKTRGSQSCVWYDEMHGRYKLSDHIDIQTIPIIVRHSDPSILLSADIRNEQ